MKRISFQLAQHEAALLAHLAARRGISQAEFVRACIREGLVRNAVQRA